MKFMFSGMQLKKDLRFICVYVCAGPCTSVCQWPQSWNSGSSESPEETESSEKAASVPGCCPISPAPGMGFLCHIVS